MLYRRVFLRFLIVGLRINTSMRYKLRISYAHDCDVYMREIAD